MVKRTQASGKKRTRANDSIAIQRAQKMTAYEAWGKMKGSLDAEMVEMVDAIMDEGFTFGDLLRLELYEHARLDKAIRFFLKRPWSSSTLVHSLASVKLQCRKHARMIMEHMAPPLSAGNTMVDIPDILRDRIRNTQFEPDDILS